MLRPSHISHGHNWTFSHYISLQAGFCGDALSAPCLLLTSKLLWCRAQPSSDGWTLGKPQSSNAMECAAARIFTRTALLSRCSVCLTAVSQAITAPPLLRLRKQPAGSRESSHVSCSVAQVEGLPGLRVRQLLVSMPVLAAQGTLRRFSGKTGRVRAKYAQWSQYVESTACCNPSQEHLHSRQGAHLRCIVIPEVAGGWVVSQHFTN